MPVSIARLYAAADRFQARRIANRRRRTKKVDGQRFPRRLEALLEIVERQAAAAIGKRLVGGAAKRHPLGANRA
jgi:hypothetical protein